MTKNWLNKIVLAFPLWIALGSIIALIEPAIFLWFKPYIAYGLIVIMVGMGLTLSLDDFKRVLKHPKYVIAASVLQFTVMPLLGYGVAYLFDLNKAFTVGMIMVACCPGGTASNVICYLARVNVALSVTMTSISTLAAIVMTPLLTTFLIGDKVDVSGWNLFLGTIKIVLIPIALGIIINRFLPNISKKIVPFSPLLALIAILLIIGSIIGGDRDVLIESGFKLLAAVTTLHISGFLIGYLLSKLILKNEQVSRTVGIEVSMQNSGLGAVLVESNFPALIGVAAPCAITGSVHNIIGSILVWIFRKWPSKDDL